MAFSVFFVQVGGRQELAPRGRFESNAFCMCLRIAGGHKAGVRFTVRLVLKHCREYSVILHSAFSMILFLCA